MNEAVTVEDMETLICQLPTVLKCAVSVNDWGAIEEIHVLTTTERAPKQIVRDVESALLAQWNLRVDHKRISVAQIVADEDSNPPRQVTHRLVVQEYHLESDSQDHRAVTRVVLASAEDPAKQIEGHWEGRYMPSQYFQAMALAAVDAVNQWPALSTPMVLSECRTLTLANRQIVLVGLSFYDKRRRETLLIGAAEDVGDGPGAAVRAVLEAVHRKIDQPESDWLASIVSNELL